jgi:hypothetical protein
MKSKALTVVTYVVTLLVGSGLMYGAWYVTDAEKAKAKVFAAEQQVIELRSQLHDSQAEVIRLSK